jgi:hypothetical protein
MLHADLQKLQINTVNFKSIFIYISSTAFLHSSSSINIFNFRKMILTLRNKIILRWNFQKQFGYIFNMDPIWRSSGVPAVNFTYNVPLNFKWSLAEEFSMRRWCRFSTWEAHDSWIAAERVCSHTANPFSLRLVRFFLVPVSAPRAPCDYIYAQHKQAHTYQPRALILCNFLQLHPFWAP